MLGTRAPSLLTAHGRSTSHDVHRMTDSSFAPYAPLRALQSVIAFHRDTGLGEPISRAELERAGVASSMTARTLQALRFLGLVVDGFGTELLDEVRRATDEDLSAVLARSVRRSYADVFSVLDPATATDGAVAEAFRLRQPAAQRPKMIALFRGLSAMAGLAPSSAADSGRPRRRTPGARLRSSPAGTMADLDPVVRAVVGSLPASRRWTPAQRQRWLDAMRAAVDLAVEVDEDVTGN